MRLSIPSDEDAGEFEDGDGGGSGSGHTIPDETVTVLGDEMDPLDAIEQMGDMLERPESFGLVPASRLTDLNERIAEVEAENGRLRRDLAVLWVHQSAEAADGEHVIPDGDGMGVAPESLDMHDPKGEFDG